MFETLMRRGNNPFNAFLPGFFLSLCLILNGRVVASGQVVIPDRVAMSDPEGAPGRPLEGTELRCCTVLESPTTFEDKTGSARGFSGIAIEYLDELEQRLGFRCKTLKLFKANKPENQGFTGFIMEMEECTENGTIIDSPRCNCDIGVGGWVLNEERMGRVDFPPTFANDDFRMLTHVDNVSYASSSGAFFLTAFSVTSWIAIFALSLCFIFLRLFDRKFTAPDLRALDLEDDTPWYIQLKLILLKSNLFQRLQRATKQTLMEIIGQRSDDVNHQSETTRQWLVTYVLLLCGLFLVLAYEATMTASLVQEVGGSEFRSIDDLRTCRIRAEDVCIPGGGGAEAFWNAAIGKSACHQGAPSYRRVATYNEGHEKVAKKECKYFLASGATTKDAAQRRYCGQVTTTGEPFFLTGTSFVLPRNSNLTFHFSLTTLQLQVFDVIDSVDQFLRKRGQCDVGGGVSLTFVRLKFFFILAFTACAILFLIMIFFPHSKKEEPHAQNFDPPLDKVTSARYPESFSIP